ncbi:DUF1648 domain-containing protein [Ureibacillus manganicus]|uniref:DUF1648 domain-containing protein n=1 Tax=Ureibacillus manganicus DSM 26584 TaxID=1384049 RepID=A0A0A3HX44_9BACL|nr:DUF5808 domain-containing protein [Ureibacillus manganicus]KGR77034.1 hypothetical protein CD29_16080 [Ureibacillus manganicus DSM 26584]
MGASLVLTIVIILFLTIAQTFIPYLVKRTVIFGVTIPEQYLRNQKLLQYKKQYSLFTFIIGLILLATFVIWVLNNNLSEEQIVVIGTFIEFGIIIISLSFYFYFHGKIKQLKHSSKWTENLKQVKVTDLSIRSQDEMLPWYVHILPMIITVGLIIYTVMNYELLPDNIPTHWGPTGEPDAFTAKTPFTAIQMPGMLLLMQFMFIGIHIATKKSGIKLSATNATASKKRQLGMRKYTSWLMFFVIFAVTILFTFFQLTTIHPNLFEGTSMQMIIPFGFLAIILIATIIFSIKIGRSDKENDPIIEGDITDIDEDRYWKGGLVYFNRNDPSIFVEKRFGIGYTLNFANPLGYLIILLPLLIIILVPFFLN